MRSPSAISSALLVAILLAGCLAQGPGELAPDAVVCPPAPDGCDHPTLREAIDAAPEGGTVQVLAGTYRETVTVDRPVHLVARDGAVLDGGDARDHGIVVEADGVTVEGFEMTGYTSAAVRVTGDDARILDNAFTDNEVGVAIDRAGGVRVADNRFAQGFVGLNASNAHDLAVEGNVFRDHAGPPDVVGGMGGFFYYTVASTVRDNVFTDNEGGGFVQSNAQPDGSSLDPANRLEGNLFEDNDEFGLALWGSVGNVVVDNAFADNEGPGLWLWGAMETTVRRNTVTGNAMRGIHLYQGAQNTTMADNEIVGNEEGGVFLDFALEGSGDNLSGDNVVRGNRVADNGGPGVQASPTARDAFVDNVFRRNDGPAIQLDTAVRGSEIHDNDLGDDGTIEVTLHGSTMPSTSPDPPVESLDMKLTASASGSFDVETEMPGNLEGLRFEVRRDGETVLSEEPGTFDLGVEPGLHTFAVEADVPFPTTQWTVTFRIR